MSDLHPTASSITDPQLDSLLTELGRLRTAVQLHAPRRTRGKRAVCQTCQGKAWPCPTARAAARPRTGTEAA
ncbi:hypothetical protein ABR738_00805 [Streptomyces sp. Edi4]|uniref:hypothetical protein n=1 Tax=Streptomyces sp. Edi4 TaxID=3162527 RepID=UPI003306789A